MSEWFVYQASGQHKGPIRTDELARGVVLGKVPRDAHVARAGSMTWQLVTTVAEVSAALAAPGSATPGPRTVPPAPPPRATLPPAALPAPRMVEVESPLVGSTLPSNRDSRAPAVVAPPTSPALSLGLFGACLVPAAGLALARLFTHAGSVSASSLVLYVGAVCTLPLGPRAATARFTAAIVLLAASAVAGHGVAAALPLIGATLAAAYTLERWTSGREADPQLGHRVAWGLVPGLAMVAIATQFGGVLR